MTIKKKDKSGLRFADDSDRFFTVVKKGTKEEKDMPFGEYSDFDDCLSKNRDKQSPEGYCAELHKKITGEYPSAAAKGEDVLALIDRYLFEHPEADITLKGIESIIDSWKKWAGGHPGDFSSCVDTLSGKPGITEPEALCAWLEHEARGKWPAEKSAELGGPLAIKSASKHIVVGPVLVPGEPDHEGEVLSAEKIEEVAHRFMEDFRYIDLSHTLKQVGVPVSSHLLDEDKAFALPDGSTLSLPKGTWMLGVRVKDDEVWKGIESGTFRGYSVMGVKRSAYEEVAGKAAGALPLGTKLEGGKLRKILLSDLGDDWIGVAVSILAQPSVFKSRFVAIKSAKPSVLSRLFSRFGIKGESPTDGRATDKNSTKEEKEMDKKELVETINEVLDERKKKETEEAEAKAKADAEAKAKEDAAKAESDTKEPPPPPAKNEDVAALQQEVSALKGLITEQGKVLDKLGDFTKAAVKSQRLSSDNDGKSGSDEKVGPKRDAYGRVTK